MLTLTENATLIAKQIAEQPDNPQATALRIASAGDAELAFAISPATQPQPEDQVLEQDGATVYLEPEAATQLDDKVLDADVDAGGNVQFSLTLQA